METCILRNILPALLCLTALSCTWEAPADGTVSDVPVPVSVTAYVGGTVTKGTAQGTATVLGSWSGDTLVPGAGIGVFAFHQKAKSNGTPTVFCKTTGDPDFMSNQRVERVTDDGVTWRFEYTPCKYWPANGGDRLSFFAYAPYDSCMAWEDMNVTADASGSRIVRHYEVDGDPADQVDLMWAAPVLNVSRGSCTEISFPFTHLCGSLAAYAVVNMAPSQTYVTVDRVTFTGAFNTSVDLVCTTEDGSVEWRDLTRSESRDWTAYSAYTVTDPETGDTRTHTWTVTQERSQVGGSGTSLLVLPGTQDVTLTAVVSQRSQAGYCRSYTITRTYPSVQVLAGRVTAFTLGVTLVPITLGGNISAEWGEEELL